MTLTLPTFTTLALSLQDHVLQVVLNRPDSANAMNAAMWQELQAAFEWADQCSEVRVVVLSGEGRHFCAGIDLSMFSDIRFEDEDKARANERFFQHVKGLQRNLLALRACRKPVLAAIHGACIGGAIDMTCYADMRYATEDATFCVKEIDIGIVADVGTLQNLPHLIPEGVVRDLAYTGRNMAADEALRVGFLNAVYADRATLQAQVLERAKLIASKTPLAMRGTKQILNYTRDHGLNDGLDFVALWNAAMMSDFDIREALTAKMEKRAAQFRD